MLVRRDQSRLRGTTMMLAMCISSDGSSYSHRHRQSFYTETAEKLCLLAQELCQFLAPGS